MLAQIYRYIAATVMRKPRSKYVSATETGFGQAPAPKKQDVFHLKIIDRFEPKDNGARTKANPFWEQI